MIAQANKTTKGIYETFCSYILNHTNLHKFKSFYLLGIKESIELGIELIYVFSTYFFLRTKRICTITKGLGSEMNIEELILHLPNPTSLLQLFVNV